MLKVDHLYRIHNKNGYDKVKFQREAVILSHAVFVCKEYNKDFTTVIIDKSIVTKIEEMTVISREDQAIAADCWIEFRTYETVNGKKIRTKFKYNEIKEN